MIPKHKDPSAKNRVAVAPYNFVPLPEAILTVDAPPEQDMYDPGLLTGKLTCTLTTASPMYVRAARTLPEYNHKDEKGKLTPITPSAPFYGETEDTLLIPGSSLRGMLRSLVEVVAHSRLAPVTQKQLFYRTVENTIVGDIFRSRMKDRVRAGFFHRDRDTAWIEPALAGRVKHETLKNYFGEYLYEKGTGPRRIPRRDIQHKPVYVQLDAKAATNPTRFFDVDSFDTKDQPGLFPGVLVITGPMNNKKREFVFVKQAAKDKINIDDQLVDLFEDDDQLTQYQEFAFPKDKVRKKDGSLQDGEPVFYLQDETGEGVEAFGRAYMFRLAYKYSPNNLGSIGNEDDPTKYDLTEALFGFVANDQQRISAAGRVFITDAILQGKAADALLTERPITLKLLSSPKPTALQHYLNQEMPDLPRSLRSYDDGAGKTRLRGHKFYWHKGNVNVEAIRAEEGQLTEHGSQFSPPVKPVKSGKDFTFSIHFENLRDEELGSLLWVLEIAANPQYRLKLGMGKPYGLGSVAIKYKPELYNRAERYKDLFDKSYWNEGWLPADISQEKIDQARNAFKSFVLSDHRNNPDNAQKIEDLPRIGELLALLTWQGYPRIDRTRYMKLDEFTGKPDSPDNPNQLTKRPVLPAASKVLDSNWYNNLSDQPSTGHQGQRSEQVKRRNQQPPASPQPHKHETVVKQQKTPPPVARARVAKLEQPSPVEKLPGELKPGDVIWAKVTDAPAQGDISLVPDRSGPEDFATISSGNRGSTKRYSINQRLLLRVISVEGDDENGWVIDAEPVDV